MKSPPRRTRRNCTPPARQPRASSNVSCAWRRKVATLAVIGAAGGDVVGDASPDRGRVVDLGRRRRGRPRPLVALGAGPDLDADPGADVERRRGGSGARGRRGSARRHATSGTSSRRGGASSCPGSGTQHLALASGALDGGELGVDERRPRAVRGWRVRRQQVAGQPRRPGRRSTRGLAGLALRPELAVEAVLGLVDGALVGARWRGTSSRRRTRRRRCRRSRRP